MEIKTGVVLRPKTTMRIGGTAKFFADVVSKADIEEAVAFAAKEAVPLIPLGSGSNTIFADGEISALVIQIKHQAVTVNEDKVTVGCGHNLPMLINELAKSGLDLSALTGIPGTVGGAIFGNAGQGPKGIWIDSFVESVTVFMDGEWETLDRNQCQFTYRESIFKHAKNPPILWEVTLTIPRAEPDAIKANIQSLLQKRIETQPHQRTAGSCFKAVGGTPAWQMIEAAGLRGFKSGDVEISTKHANFLISGKEPKYSDAVAVVETVKQKIPQNLEVEMRFVEPNGTLRF